MNASTETDNIVDKDKKGGIWVVEKAKKWKLRRKTTTIKKNSLSLYGLLCNSQFFSCIPGRRKWKAAASGREFPLESP